MSDTRSFGRWLKQRRKALDWTQDDLARRVGCAVVTIQKIEAGALRPSRQVAERLADQLGIAPEGRVAFVEAARIVSSTTLPDLPRPAINGASGSLARPALKSLPTSPTPLLGRAHDVAAVCQGLLRHDVRLLTLIGPPGIGKTRLGVEVASNLRDVFADGVAFVALAPIRDPGLIATTIAKVLDVQESSAQPLVVSPRAFFANESCCCSSTTASNFWQPRRSSGSYWQRRHI
jgi:transcriptional regulator with XRE-family HTH domain